MVVRYFKSLFGILQHLISIVLVILLLISMIPGYYKLFSTYFIILVVLQMFLSFLKLRLVNIFLETIFLFLALVGFIPYLGWLARLFALPVALLDMTSFRAGVVFKKVEFFTRESLKSRYEGYWTKRRESRFKRKEKREKSSRVIDAEFKEK